MARTKLFGSSEIGAVAIVDPPVSQWYARRARVTALVVSLACDALVTAVLSVFAPLLIAGAGRLAGPGENHEDPPWVIEFDHRKSS